MKGIGIVLAFLLAASNGYAQWQIGITGGAAHYKGDLTDHLITRQLVRPAFGVHVKYEATPRVLVRGTLQFAQVAGHDRYQNKDYLQLRNMSFESNITEASVVGELHTFRIDERRFSPYLFGGVALYRFNPYTYDVDGQKVYLQPLGTEGQGLEGYPQRDLYSRNGLAIPFGGGLRFNITDAFVVGAELGFRKLFTDYLDDVSTNFAAAEDLMLVRGPQAVSVAYREDEMPGGNPLFPAKGAQRGNASEKDMYFLGQLQLSIRLGQGGLFGGGGGRSGRRGNYGCPVVPQ